MAVVVRTAWGTDETYKAATDWLIDRDHDLAVITEISNSSTTELATFSSGQWLRVTRDVPASTPTA